MTPLASAGFGLVDFILFVPIAAFLFGELVSLIAGVFYEVEVVTDKLVKLSLKNLSKSIGELIGQWEEDNGFEVTRISLTAAGVYIVAKHSDITAGASKSHAFLSVESSPLSEESEV